MDKLDRHIEAEDAPLDVEEEREDTICRLLDGLIAASLRVSYLRDMASSKEMNNPSRMVFELGQLSAVIDDTKSAAEKLFPLACECITSQGELRTCVACGRLYLSVSEDTRTDCVHCEYERPECPLGDDDGSRVEQQERDLADDAYRRDLMGGAASDDADWYGPDDDEDRGRPFDEEHCPDCGGTSFDRERVPDEAGGTIVYVCNNPDCPSNDEDSEPSIHDDPPPDYGPPGSGAVIVEYD